MDADTSSPFSVTEEELRSIESSTDFQVVRSLLAEQNNQCCQTHNSLPTELLSTFTLHRDILHAVLLPIRQIRSQAALYASHALSHPTNPNPNSTRARPSTIDLEVAFRGPARSAFSWLQCFISQEEEWTLTQGCPACVVLRVLHDEPYIRIVVAACRLSSYLQDVLHQHADTSEEAPNNSNSNNNTGAGGGGGGGGGLPDFSFWLTAVLHAVTEDSFWGLHFWSDIESRAVALEAGMKELIAQCMCRQNSPPQHPQQVQAPPVRSVSDSTSTSVQHGSVVRRELALRREEEVWMQRVVEAYWVELLAEAARTRERERTVVVGTSTSTNRAFQQHRMGMGATTARKRSLTS